MSHKEKNKARPTGLNCEPMMHTQTDRKLCTSIHFQDQRNRKMVLDPTNKNHTNNLNVKRNARVYIYLPYNDSFHESSSKIGNIIVPSITYKQLYRLFLTLNVLHDATLINF